MIKLSLFLYINFDTLTKMLPQQITIESCDWPEENEEVIEWVVNKTPDALRVEKISLANLSFQNGLTTWKHNKFMHTTNCARIFPSKTMEGFFIAKLYKTASTLPSSNSNLGNKRR